MVCQVIIEKGLGLSSNNREGLGFFQVIIQDWGLSSNNKDGLGFVG